MVIECSCEMVMSIAMQKGRRYCIRRGAAMLHTEGRATHVVGGARRRTDSTKSACGNSAHNYDRMGSIRAQAKLIADGLGK
jgi:hypothetical protein